MYGPDVRARAIAALMLGASAHAVARELGVPRTTVRRWKTAPKKERAAVGERVATYLHEGLESLTEQAERFRDPAWLRQQSAADLAILHGQLADRLFRVVAGLDVGEP